MPAYKVTIGLLYNVFGASESYYSAVGATDSSIGGLVTDLLGSRRAMLPVGVQFTGVRIAEAPAPNTNDPAPRHSNFYPPDTYHLDADGIELFVPGSGLLPLITDPALKLTAPKSSADQTRSSLMCKVRFSGNRRANRYLSFPPDGVLYSEPDSYHPAGFAGWTTLMANWEQRLKTGGWQLRARSQDKGFTAQNIKYWDTSEQGPGTMGFVMNNTPAPGLNQGDWVQIKGVKRRGTDTTSYNGKYKISGTIPFTATGETAYYLDGTEAGEPASIKIAGNVTKIAYQYYPFDFYTGWTAVAHKRGRPFGSPLGRRKTRPSLAH